MTERVVISVDPGAAVESQKVQDVFLHVLDLFDLLAESAEVPRDGIAWRLVRVSMNSPLTVVAEAVAVRPDLPFKIDDVAAQQKRGFARNLREVKEGRLPRDWSGGTASMRVRRSLSRTNDGVTRVRFSDARPADGAMAQEPDVEFVAADVPAVELAVAVAPTSHVALKPKIQVGSVEGKLLDVSTYHGKPAIRIRERKTQQDLWCLVTEDHRQEIAGVTNFEDVWQGRRVLVEGTVVLNGAGDVSRVIATHVSLISPQAVSVEKLHDPSFTSGLSSVEYLERLREGQLD